VIRFERVAKPAGFEEAEVAGARWLTAHPADRPRDYWSPFRGHLADGFRNLCGYSAMYEPVGTVDHFVSCDEDRSRTYDWHNYRFASGWLNSSKQGLRAKDVLDPFEVGDDWFEILLPSLELVATDAVPPLFRERAKLMLDRLHLAKDVRVMRQRRAWYRRFTAGKMSLELLHELAPLIARAVVKQQAAQGAS
jgi:hypothetical protein